MRLPPRLRCGIDALLLAANDLDELLLAANDLDALLLAFEEALACCFAYFSFWAWVSCWLLEEPIVPLPEAPFVALPACLEELLLACHFSCFSF